MASAAQRRIKSISYAKYGYLFILPFFLVYFFFQLYPLINTFIVAFHGNKEADEHLVVGLQNFQDLLFGDRNRATRKIHENFVLSFKNTFILWIGNFIPQIALSLSLAVWFTDSKLKIPGKGFFKVVMYLPNIITAASVAVLFLQLCGEAESIPGTLNMLLSKVGIVPYDPASRKYETIQFVSGMWESRIVVMFIQTWMWFGNTMIMLMSGIMGINPSLFEAASIDGANSGQVFRKITFPLLAPIMAYTLVTSMIGGLQMFDIPYLYKRDVSNVSDNLKTVAVFIYEKFHPSAGGQKQFGYSGAASVLLFFITLVLGCIAFYITRDKDEIARKKQIKKNAKQAQLANKQFGGLSL